MISNSSPIIGLAAIGRLELLKELYGGVLVPEAVYREVTAPHVGEPGAVRIESRKWIESQKVNDRKLVGALKTELDEGEAEAIALACELKADLLLIDERRGRAVAARLGLTFIGLLAVLIQAKQEGHIKLVKPLLNDLIQKGGFWMTERLYRRVLDAAGELE